MQYISFFHDISLQDGDQFGGKNASIGEMIQRLQEQNVRVPHGFATTAAAYWHHLDSNNLREPIQNELDAISADDSLQALRKAGEKIRLLIAQAPMPDDLADEICSAYKELSQWYDQDTCDVAVRSSATAEDLPTASFAGQQDTFLNVSGCDELIDRCKKSMASLA